MSMWLDYVQNQIAKLKDDLQCCHKKNTIY